MANFTAIPSLPKSASSIRGYFIGAGGSPLAGYGDYALRFEAEFPSRWSWVTIPPFSSVPIPAGSRIEFRDTAEEILGQTIYTGLNASRFWTAKEEAEYAVARGQWMVRPRESFAYANLRGLQIALNGWQHCGTFLDNDQAGFGWHGQDGSDSGYGPDESDETARAYVFCRVYGRTNALGDKLKAEEIKILTQFRPGEIPALSFAKKLNLSNWIQIDGVVTRLPEESEFNGGLEIIRSNITTLPEAMDASGTIRLATHIADVPAYSFKVAWDFSGRYRVPTLSTGGSYSTGWIRDWSIDEVDSLNARDNSINSLPENLIVDGDLILDGCPLRSLPSGLIVGGKLSLRRCWFETIPEDVECQILDLCGAVVDDWPDDLPGVQAIKWTSGKRNLPEAIKAKLQR